MVDKYDPEASVERVETTIGELVEIFTQLARGAGNSEQESYQLASLALESILCRDRSETRE